MSLAEVKALIGKELHPVTWDRYLWEDPEEVQNLKASESKEFISPEEQSLYP